MDAIWHPTPAYIEGSYLQQLMQRLGLGSYQALYDYSVKHPQEFFAATFQQMGLEWFKPYQQVLDNSQGPQWPQWFVGGELNLAHNAVTRHLKTHPQRTALLWEGEDGQVQQLSYAQLEGQVAKAAGALKQLGVQKGDRVGLFLPMILPTAVAALAIARIGAIMVPVFSGYGPDATATRLNDAQAKLLITADGFLRRGARVNLLAAAREAAALSPSVTHLLVVPRLGGAALQANEVDWEQALAQAPESPTQAMHSMDPFMLIYTSGTTGKPKGTVHYHAGFPLKAAQDIAHCFDVRPGEVLFWFTDMGWMMGPWAILGGLTLGVTVFLYEGAPDYPGPDRLWALVAKHRISHMGISPTLVRALVPHGATPVQQHDLSSLRVLGSTGEPWNLEPYMWFFNTVGQGRLPIINYSGGTEIAGGILGCVTHRPIKPMGFNTAVPGIKAAVLNSQAQPVHDQVGELAILGPWPGQTKGFWNAPERYLSAYWERFENIWVHGDWAVLDSQGHWSVQGRSDDTLKVAGKRVGPAEYESAAVEHPAVKEAAAIGVPHEVKGETVVVFVVLRPNQTASPELEKAIAEQIVQRLGKALKPEKVLFVNDLPKTRNAKVMRRVIRAAFLGQNPGDLSALENPQAVEGIQQSAH